MKVRELILELIKFPMDAEVNAYEGEVTGINISNIDGDTGFIYTEDEVTTELLRWGK